jgi:hypothetical protein
MFGGVAFLTRGRMCVGIVTDDLMVRVGPDAHASLMGKPHVRPMDFTGRPMKGFLYVSPEGYESDADLSRWVEHAMTYVSALPPKQAAGKRRVPADARKKRRASK